MAQARSKLAKSIGIYVDLPHSIASSHEIGERRARNNGAIRKNAVAISVGNCTGKGTHSRDGIESADHHWLVKAVRVLVSWQRLELVKLQLHRKVNPFASYVGDARKHLLGQLAFYTQAPLLHVRPNCLCRN